MKSHMRLLAVLIASVVRLDITYAACGGDSNACGAPPTNSDVTYTPVTTCYNDEAIATYQCSGTLTGPTENECSGGSWTSPSPNCDVFSCGRPEVESDVTLTPDKTTYDAREVVAYSCPQGESLEGASSATCNSQNSWVPAGVPLCQALCPVPTINNGAVPSGEYKEGDTVTVTCDSGYSLEAGQSSTITCGDNGSWDTLPRCLETCTVPNIPNSDFANGATLNHGQTVYIDCDTGYSYQQETEFEVTCFYDGLRYSTVSPDQCYSDCPAWTAPANGAVTSTDLHGSTATFSCNTGYYIENPEDATTTCNDGTWSRTDANPPDCIIATGTDRITLNCNSDGFRVMIPVDMMTDQTGRGLHLQDETCVGKASNGYAVLKSTYSDCDTTFKVVKYTEEITYMNRVRAEDFEGGITNEVFFDLSIECIFDQKRLVSTTFIIANNITSALGFHGGPRFSLRFYGNDSFLEQRTPPVHLRDHDLAYVKIELQSDSTSTLFGTHCHASPSSDPLNEVTHDLLSDGCAVDKGVTILDTSSKENFPRPTTAFSMSKIHFSGGENSVYIHCFTKLCEEGDVCSSTCDHRRKRRSSDQIYHRTSNGPIIWTPETTADRRLNDNVVTSLLFVCAVVSTISLALVLFVAYRRLSRKTPTKQDQEEEAECHENLY